jgi:predicted 3-demethylubiquinone-9 3-methyltransferase (glyoxalase superfamily)
MATISTQSKISPCLWYVNEGEDAAKLYTSLFPNSRIDHVQRSPTDYPGGKAGAVLVVGFTLAGQSFQALNGGEKVEYTHALSLSIDCADQAEVDKYWDGLIQGGGAPIQCGWLKDRWGVQWQVVPRALPEMLSDKDPAKAARVFQAMMQMVKIDVAALKKAYEGG